jgi:hypothetical protein
MEFSEIQLGNRVNRCPTSKTWGRATRQNTCASKDEMRMGSHANAEKEKGASVDRGGKKLRKRR